jgi:glutathione S-transferase
MSLLGLKHQLIPIDLMAGKHKSPEFLRLNSLGQVPVLTDGDLTLADSQAILVYLARRYGNEAWLPNDAESLSCIVRWLSISAAEIRQGLATARLFYLLNNKGIDIEAVTEKSAIMLQQLEQHLTDREWLELGHLTIADIALFPYVALAPDGKISLKPYPQILAWCDRLRQLPGFISMPGI